VVSRFKTVKNGRFTCLFLRMLICFCLFKAFFSSCLIRFSEYSVLLTCCSWTHDSHDSESRQPVTAQWPFLTLFSNVPPHASYTLHHVLFWDSNVLLVESSFPGPFCPSPNLLFFPVVLPLPDSAITTESVSLPSLCLLFRLLCMSFPCLKDNLTLVSVLGLSPVLLRLPLP